MKRLLRNAARLPVLIYRLAVSPFLRPRCRFYPTCSAYMLDALDTHGLFKGMTLGILRISRCHPWREQGGHDPVPKRFAWGDVFSYKRTHKPKAQRPPDEERRTSR